MSELLFWAAFLAVFAKFAWLGLSPTDASDFLGVMLAAGIVVMLSFRTRSDLFAITLSVLSLLLAHSNYPLQSIVGFSLVGGALGGIISAVLTRLRSALERHTSPRIDLSRTALVQRIAVYIAASVIGFAQALGAKLEPLAVVLVLSATVTLPLLFSRRLERRDR